MNIYILVGAAVLLLGGGIGLGYFIRQVVARQRKSSIEARLKKLVDDSKAEAKEILIGAKEKAAKILDEAKGEEKERLQQLRKLEERFSGREVALDKRVGDFERKENEFAERVEKVKAIKVEIETRREQVIKELERVSGLSKDDAVREIMNRIEKEYADDLVVRIRKLEQNGVEELERRAKNTLAALIQRLATATTSEVTTTTVTNPSDDLKGKIIGRDGANINEL